MCLCMYLNILDVCVLKKSLRALKALRQNFVVSTISRPVITKQTIFVEM